MNRKTNEPNATPTGCVAFFLLQGHAESKRKTRRPGGGAASQDPAKSRFCLTICKTTGNNTRRWSGKTPDFWKFLFRIQTNFKNSSNEFQRILIRISATHRAPAAIKNDIAHRAAHALFLAARAKRLRPFCVSICYSI